MQQLSIPKKFKPIWSFAIQTDALANVAKLAIQYIASIKTIKGFEKIFFIITLIILFLKLIFQLKIFCK